MKLIDTTEFASGFCPECGIDVNNAMDWLIWSGMLWERAARASENAETATEIEEALAWQAELRTEIETHKAVIKLHCTTF